MCPESKMAYIPDNHKKYNILPMCRKNGGEVFSYPGKLIDELEKFLPEDENMMPYGYDSIEEYMAEMDKFADRFFVEEKSSLLYDQFKTVMCEMNRKENWSILRYLGESDDKLFGLTHGSVYYWPCSKSNPHYEGVIDDEEFTSYWYSTEVDEWEILEDPMGMAYATLYGDAKEHVSKEQYNTAMEQIEQMMEE